MTRIYNRPSQTQTRRRLRSDAPKPERLLWSKLRAQQMDGLKFRRQYGVGDYILDFYCPRAKLAIDVDGESHFEQTAQARDARRQAFIESFGIHVLRFTNPDVYDRLDDVVEEVWRVARDRIPQVRTPMPGENPPRSPLGKGRGMEGGGLG